jgi:MarR family transcriptional regulator, organic hydroperoxide resistance regulator
MSDPEQWSAARLLVTARRLVENACNAELAGLGLTYPGLTVLSVLATQGAFTQIQLAEELKVQSQTLGKMLSGLVRKGFVFRWQDQRSHMVSISPAGEDVLASALRIEDRLGVAEELCSDSLRGLLQRLVRVYG